MKKIIIIIIHALIGWALCGSIIAVGRSFLPMDVTLIIHAIGAPVVFSLISIIYFKKFNYTEPLITAIVFIIFVVSMDFFVVALLIEKSFAMFKSIIGTWAPFALIFSSTYLTGLAVTKN